jgi:Rad3-related DNA helicase
MSQVNLIKDYLKNANEIVSLAEKEKDKFSFRAKNETYNFSTEYGDSHMKSLFYVNMSEELKEAIFKTLPKEDRTANAYVINRYDPGDYLQRHKDSLGGYWKFKLIYLQSDKPHFVWYDDEGNANLVEEEPGAYLQMPINFEHEVTQIGLDERPKYSLVLSWGYR